MAYNGAAAGTQSALFKGKQWRRLLRIEKAAQLTIKGVFSNEQIASFLKIHPQTLVYLKQTPEFKSRMIALQTGVIEQHDLEIREDEEYQRQQLKDMVPVALMKLRELASSNNQGIALRASQDILDREGTHALVSRSAIDVRERTSLTVVDQVAASIMDVLNAAPKPLAELVAETNSVQDEISAEFTKGATDSQSQLYMMEEQIQKDAVENFSPKKIHVVN